MRETKLEINLAHLENNIRFINEYTNGIEICAVVKANAYGHGVLQIARTLLLNGIKWFAVATFEEAIYLRKHGINNPNILILGAEKNIPIDEFIKYNLTPSIYSIDMLNNLSNYNKMLDVHLEIDTGMNRLGIKPSDIDSFIRDYISQSNIKIKGVFTHFSNADLLDEQTNKKQLQLFSQFIQKLHINNIPIKICHVANSAGILTQPDSYFDMVRPGLLIYGISPIDKSNFTSLKMVIRWTTKAIQIKTVLKGEVVSYGGTWKASKDTKVAILPVGYADGYNRVMTHKAQVLVKETRIPVIGVICMDYIIVDLSSTPTVNYTDEFVLLGNQGKASISIYEMSNWSNSIPYEIMCNISNRVPRVYIR